MLHVFTIHVFNLLATSGLMWVANNKTRQDKLHVFCFPCFRILEQIGNLSTCHLFTLTFFKALVVGFRLKNSISFDFHISDQRFGNKTM